MASWYFKGRTPHVVDTSDRGSVIVTRGTKFQAHEHAVAHLVRAGIVVAQPERRPVDAPAQALIPTVKAQVEAPVVVIVASPAPVAPEELPPGQDETSEDIESFSDSDGDSDVVGSSAQVEGSADAERDDGEAVPEKKQSESRRKRRQR